MNVYASRCSPDQWAHISTCSPHGSCNSGTAACNHGIVRTTSLLGDWLAERGLTPADAGEPELQEYMAAHKRTPKGRLSDGAVGFSRLPALLAAEGVLCKPDAPAPGDGCLRRFQILNTNDKGFAFPTIRRTR